MAKNILVTGGLGAVGSYLVNELRGRGNQHQQTAAARSHNRT